MRAGTWLRAAAGGALTLLLASTPVAGQQPPRQQASPPAGGLQQALDTCNGTSQDWPRIEAACTQLIVNPAGRRSINLPEDQLGALFELRARARMNQGNKARDTIADYNAAIQRNHRAHFAWTNIGVVSEHQLRDLDGAERAYRAALQVKDDFLPPRINLAILLTARGKLREAVQELQLAREIAQRDVQLNAQQLPVILAQLGEALYQERRLDEAREVIIEAVNRQPENINARIRLAQILLDQGRTNEAERQLADLAERNSANPEILVAAGHGFAQLRKWRQSAEYCTNARTLSPTHVEAALCLSFALSGMGQLQRAENVLTDASDRARNDPRLLTALGIMRKRRGFLDEATASFRAALAANQRTDEARHFLISTLIDRGRLGDAFQEAADTLRLIERDAKVYSLRAIAFALNSEEAKASADLDLLKGVVGETSDYAMTRGIVLYYLGRTREAIGHLQQAEAKNRDNAEALRFLGRALIRERRFAEAQQALDRAEVIIPHEWQTRRTRGLLELEQGRFAAARDHLEDSIQLNGAFVEAYVALGRSYEGLQRTQLAISSYEQALSSDRPKLDYDNDGREARAFARRQLALLRSREAAGGAAVAEAPRPVPSGGAGGGAAVAGGAGGTVEAQRDAAPPGGAGLGEAYCGLLQRWSRSSEHYTGVRISLGCRRR